MDLSTLKAQKWLSAKYAQAEVKKRGGVEKKYSFSSPQIALKNMHRLLYSMNRNLFIVIKSFKLAVKCS